MSDVMADLNTAVNRSQSIPLSVRAWTIMRALVSGVAAGVSRCNRKTLARDVEQHGEPAVMVLRRDGKKPDLNEVVAELRSTGIDSIAVPGDLKAADFLASLSTQPSGSQAVSTSPTPRCRGRVRSTN